MLALNNLNTYTVFLQFLFLAHISLSMLSFSISISITIIMQKIIFLLLCILDHDA